MHRGHAFRKRPVVPDNTASYSAARTPLNATTSAALVALGHAILVKQCELDFGYPVAALEVPEQTVITGYHRAKFLEMAMLLLGRRVAYSRIRQGNIQAAIEGFPGASWSNHNTVRRGFEVQISFNSTR